MKCAYASPAAHRRAIALECGLAARFRVFAQAQERAISARKATARMRGLFFASVSHDLKSPLNAILGFTELVRKSETLSAGQSESLSLIDRRGRERAEEQEAGQQEEPRAERKPEPDRSPRP